MKRECFWKWSKYLFCFIFFFLISFWMPISGDDWHNYEVGSQGIRLMIGQAIGMYFDWEGRFVSRLFINFLTYYKFLFNFLLASLTTLMLYFIEHLGLVKNKSSFFLLIVGLFLLLDNPLFTQTFLWVAGSITYLFPSILIIGYFFVYLHYLKGKRLNSKILRFFFYLFAFLMPMFVENIAFSFVLLNFLLVIYERVFFQRWNRFLLMMTGISFLGALLCLVSPGSLKRMELESAVYHLTGFQKIEFNFSLFIQYTLSNNFYLLLLMIFSGLTISKNVLRGPLKIISCFSLLFLPIFLLWPIGIPQWIINLLWVLFLCYLYVLLFKAYQNKPEDLWFHGILQFMGLASQLIMILTPAISSRTSLFWVLCSSISWIYVLDDLVLFKMPKILYYILEVFMGLICGVYLIAYYNMSCFARFLDQSIKTDVQENNSLVRVFEAPFYLAWGLTPSGDYHTRTFKSYYGISDEQTLIYQESVWKYFIFFDEEETILRLKK